MDPDTFGLRNLVDGDLMGTELGGIQLAREGDFTTVLGGIQLAREEAGVPPERSIR